MRDLNLVPDNDNLESEPIGNIFIPVCRACYCKSEWTECQHAGLCPHSYEDDAEFSSRCVEAYIGLKNGYYKDIRIAAKRNGISVNGFCRFVKIKGIDIKEDYEMQHV